MFAFSARLHADPAQFDAFIKKADAAYEASVKQAKAEFNRVRTEAEGEAEKAIAEAAAKRKAVYESRLKEHTKAGDFAKAQEVKDAIDDMATQGVTAGRPQPKETIRFGGHRYAIIEEAKTWHMAKEACEGMGGHLATFETAKEMTFVVNFLQTKRTDVWLGATHESAEWEWKWVTGDPVTVQLGSRVARYRPNAFYLKYDNHQGLQNDPDQRMYFMCEWDR